MRKILILVVILLAVGLGAYFLFFRTSEPATQTEVTSAPKAPARQPAVPSSPVHHPSKYHPDHYTGPTNKYADDYFKNEYLREELHYDREDLADYINEQDRYNHYDYHDQYQQVYDDYYRYDDYYYDNYYDYAYPQYEEYWEWERLNALYNDPDVQGFIKAELDARKLEKEGPKPDENELRNLPQDRLSELNRLLENRPKSNLNRLNQATKNDSVDKIHSLNNKLSDPVIKKENNIKQQFLKGQKEDIAKIGPNKVRTLDLFQVKKGDVKFYVFGTHEKETFRDALPEDLNKKVLGADVLISDDSSEEIRKHFTDSNKQHNVFDRLTLEHEIAQYKNMKVVVVVKAALLFGDDGLLKHLVHSGYGLMRYNPDLELLKYEPR